MKQNFQMLQNWQEYYGHISTKWKGLSIAGLIVTNNRCQLDAESVDHVIFMNKALKKRCAQEGKKPTSIPLIKEEVYAPPSQEPNMELDGNLYYQHYTDVKNFIF